MYRTMVDVYKSPISLIMAATLVYCSTNKETTPQDGRGVGGYLPQEAKIGTLQPCDDVEYEFSHICPHVCWAPGFVIDPRDEVIVSIHLSMPFDLGEGSALITLRVEDQPIFEDRLDFTCELILSAKDYIPFSYTCPLAVNTNISLSYTFTDVLGLKAYPGEYEVDLRLKNIDGYGVCCTTEITILG